jgi:hypothetical protein
MVTLGTGSGRQRANALSGKREAERLPSSASHETNAPRQGGGGGTGHPAHVDTLERGGSGCFSSGLEGEPICRRLTRGQRYPLGSAIGAARDGRLLRLTYRVRCRTSIVMIGLFEPPPGREVGELSARPFGFYNVYLAKRCYSIALHYTENKGYSQSSILISPLIPRLDLVRRYTYIYIYSNACLEMSALVCRVPTLFLCRF